MNKKIGNWNPWNKGKELSENIRRKMSLATSGDKNFQYKDGRTMKEHFCSCGNKICYPTALYGSGKCKSCSMTGKKRIGLKGCKSPRYKDGRSTKKYNCKDCGKEIKWRAAIYGTWKCTSCCRRGFLKGINNPMWKGGVTSENDLIRKSIEYRLWREAVFSRDNWNCQECGERKYLHAHHIKSFAKYPKLRFAIDNGISLCIECHIEIHKDR